jgi:predicted Zn-dependent protease
VPFSSFKKSCLGLICFVSLALFPLTTSQQSRANDIKLPMLGDTTSGIVSLQQEHELGRAWLKMFRSRVATLNDPLTQDYIENLVYRLASHSELMDRRLELIVINNPTMNAFAVPGGVVGVHTGLFLYAENEAQLSSVLAHELAHLSQRHFARNLANRKASSYTTMAGMLVGLILAATVGGDAGMAAMTMTQASAIDSGLRFSRQYEQEADRLGIDTLYRADMDPNAVPAMFERMLAATRYIGRRPPEFLLTHPLSEKRVADARGRTSKLPARYYPDNLDYHLIRARALIAIDGNAQRSINRFNNELQGHSLSTEAATYGLALAQSGAGRHQKARKNLQTLLDNSPQRFIYQFAAIELDRASEDFDQAFAGINKLSRDHPNSYPLQTELAETLLQNRQYSKSEQVLEALAQQRPNDPNVWFELAETSGLAGDIPGVHIARAEYYILTGVFGKAREQLRYAKKLVRQDFKLTAVIDQRLVDLNAMEAKMKKL